MNVQTVFENFTQISGITIHLPGKPRNGLLLFFQFLINYFTYLHIIVILFRHLIFQPHKHRHKKKYPQQRHD